MKNSTVDRLKVKDALDTCFSPLDERQSLRYEILRKAKGEVKVKKKISAALVLALVTLLLSATALAVSLLYDPVSTTNDTIQSIDRGREIYDIYSNLWAAYSDSGTQVTDEDHLLYDTILSKIVFELYFGDDWQALMKDLTALEQDLATGQNPAWVDDFRALLRKDYIGITAAREGFPAKTEVMPMMQNLPTDIGFDASTMANHVYTFSTYHENYRPVWEVTLGQDMQQLRVRITPELNVYDLISWRAYELRDATDTPTVDDKTKAEQIARAFNVQYPHVAGMELGELSFRPELLRIGEERVIRLAFFVGAFDGETMTAKLSGDEKADLASKYLNQTYIKEDWPSLLADLRNFYNQKYHELDPSWAEYCEILRRDYAGINAPRPGFPTKEQIEPLLAPLIDLVSYTGDLPNKTYLYYPNFARYDRVVNVNLGLDDCQLSIAFT